MWKFRFQNRRRVATLSHLRQVINGNKLRTSSTCLEDRCLGSICYELYCCRFSHLRTILKSGHFVPVLVRSGLCRQLIGKRESIQNGQGAQERIGSRGSRRGSRYLSSRPTPPPTAFKPNAGKIALGHFFFRQFMLESEGRGLSSDVELSMVESEARR